MIYSREGHLKRLESIPIAVWETDIDYSLSQPKAVPGYRSQTLTKPFPKSNRYPSDKPQLLNWLWSYSLPLSQHNPNLTFIINPEDKFWIWTSPEWSEGCGITPFAWGNFWREVQQKCSTKIQRWKTWMKQSCKRLEKSIEGCCRVKSAKVKKIFFFFLLQQCCKIADACDTSVLMANKRNGSNRGGATFQEGRVKRCVSSGQLSVSSCPSPVAQQKQNDYFSLCPGQPQKIQFTAQ